jgi:hypothetical protein
MRGIKYVGGYTIVRKNRKTRQLKRKKKGKPVIYVCINA